MALDKLVIATRASRLALWQAEHVKETLQDLYPEMQVELLSLSTRGDEILDRSLSKIGGKGLFIKELEHALLDGRAHIAVHSLKDVPYELPAEFSLAAILPRGNSCDAYVSGKFASLADMPKGAVVGTSSLRRESQIRARYPHLVVKPLRGNLDTRLGKLDAGEFDAIILAAAGLERLGMQDRIRTILSPEDSLPSAGQGALGIEINKERTDLLPILEPLICAESTARAEAERSVSRVLGGSCQVPMAAYAEIQPAQGAVDTEKELRIRALVAEPDGSVVYRAEETGPVSEARVMGERVAKDLIAQGADEILKRLGQEGNE